MDNSRKVSEIKRSLRGAWLYPADFLPCRTKYRQKPEEGKRPEREKISGSMTVEAAILIPLFLFFSMNILYVLEMYRTQTHVLAALQQSGNRIGTMAFYYRYAPEEFQKKQKGISFLLSQGFVRTETGRYLSRSGCGNSIAGGRNAISYFRSHVLEDGETVELTADYFLRPWIRVAGYPPIGISTRYYGHAWVGYGAGKGKNEQKEDAEEMVYVTETGTVYHGSRDCSYLRQVLRGIETGKLKTARNSGGGKYYPCEVCRPKGEGIVYITEYGNRFHKDESCSALKRTVREVPRKMAEGCMPGCSRCIGK